MSIYAFADIDDGRAVKINASVRFPSRQDGNIFFDSSHPINLKFGDELPVKVEGLYSVVAFRPSHILLSRDVLGGKSLYYNPFTLTFSSFKSYFSEQAVELMPGETVKIGYDSRIISRSIHNFEEVFPEETRDIEELVDTIRKALSSFDPGFSCLAFSGGVDSSLLASLYDIPLISVTASKQEEEWVKNAARMLDRDIEILKFKERDVREAIPRVISAIETEDKLQVSIAIPEYFTLKFAKELGYRNVVFGQGADELFGGYKRYEAMDKRELEYELQKDIMNIGRDNLVRDSKLAYSLEMNIMTPYLQWDVIRAGINIPADSKIRKANGSIVRKFILRELALEYIPKEIAYRDKKAFQYSTRTSSILMKLARKEEMMVQEYLEKFK
jgi:asparagine synthase (glutamine-hydrolysing)